MERSVFYFVLAITGHLILTGLLRSARNDIDSTGLLRPDVNSGLAITLFGMDLLKTLA